MYKKPLFYTTQTHTHIKNRHTGVYSWEKGFLILEEKQRKSEKNREMKTKREGWSEPNKKKL